MGKSTVGKMFVKHGIPLLDADQVTPALGLFAMSVDIWYRNLSFQWV